MGVIPFQAAYVFDDVDDIYWAHEVLLTDILNEHAPVKEKYVKTKVCPFINTKLRKASYKKAMLFNKYKQCRSTANWEAYRKQRNLTNNIKRNSVRTYLDERCAGVTGQELSRARSSRLLSARLCSEPGVVPCQE